jgi:hypothetical protein
MKMILDGIVQDIPENKIRRYSAIGWTPVVEEGREEIIRLKPPTVKSKATVTAVEEANINQQGDE